MSVYIFGDHFRAGSWSIRTTVMGTRTLWESRNLEGMGRDVPLGFPSSYDEGKNRVAGKALDTNCMCFGGAEPLVPRSVDFLGRVMV